VGQFFNRHSNRALALLAAAAATAVFVHTMARQPRRDPPHFGAGAPTRKAFAPALRVPRFFREWRENFLEAAADSDASGLVRGIFLGDTTATSPEVAERFRVAGLSHLLSASGFNCWIVSLAFGAFGAIALALAQGCLSARALLHARAHVSGISRLAGAWLFWAWTDQSPPITRCALLVSLKYALEAAGLVSAFPRILVVQYLASLAVMPRLWHSASFQLTFGCLFGIIAVPAAGARWRPRKGWRRLAWDYLASGLGACLGAAPMTWLAFGEMNFNGVLTGIFAIPIVNLIVMPAGLAIMALSVPGAAWPQAAGALAIAAAAGAETLDAIVQSWITVMPSVRYVD
jgi:competence protein ComEC